jgi:hypothetical protein
LLSNLLDVSSSRSFVWLLIEVVCHFNHLHKN